MTEVGFRRDSEPEVTDPDRNPADVIQAEDNDKPSMGPAGGVRSIEGYVGTVVTDARGSVHTGSGDLHVHTGSVVHISNGREVQRRARTSVGPDHPIRLHARFVPPPAFDRLQRLLAEPGSIALVEGPSGSGRLTAAYMALCPKGADPASLRMLPAQPDDGEPILHPDEIAPHDRLVLDISGVDADGIATLQHSLRALRPALPAHHARLVVVISHAQLEAFDDDLRQAVVTIGRPDPAHVLVSHLVADAIDVQVPDIRSLIPAIGNMPMRSVAELARLTLEAAREQPAADVHFWIAQAVSATGDTRRVETLINKRTDTPTRALLLSAALLEHRPVDEVFAAEQQLLTVLGFRHTIPLLEHHSLLQRLDELTVEPGPSFEQHVRFTALRFGDDVLTHFWTGYPNLRRKFAVWVRHVFQATVVPPGDRLAVAERFVRPAMATGCVDDVFFVARELAKDHRSSQIAHDVLAAALLDERLGYRVRKQLYVWSRTKNLDAELASICIALCVNVVAPSYLGQALVRLSWFRSHGDPQISKEARDALVMLARDDYVRWRLLHVIMNARAFDAELFVAVTAPSALIQAVGGSAPPIRSARLQRLLVQGWGEILVRAAPDHVTAAVGPWLEAHAGLAPNRRLMPGAALIEVMVGACDGRMPALGSLFKANRAWYSAACDDVEKSRRAATVHTLEQAVLKACRSSVSAVQAREALS